MQRSQSYVEPVCVAAVRILPATYLLMNLAERFILSSLSRQHLSAASYLHLSLLIPINTSCSPYEPVDRTNLAYDEPATIVT